MKLLEKYFGKVGKNILTLISGTTLAQVLPILVSPIISRLFTPEDFGKLALFMAVSTTLSTFSASRYELSLIQVKSDIDTDNIFYFTFLSSFTFSIIIAIIFFCFKQPLLDLLGISDLGDYLLLTPAAIFSITIYVSITYYLNRKGGFKAMSFNKVINGTLNAVFTLLFGWLGFTDGGLVFAFLLAQYITISSVILKVFKTSFFQKRFIDIKKSLLHYTEYPKYMVPSTLASELTGHVPVIQLSAFFNSTVTGWFNFANRLVAAPISLIGNAIGEVYRQEAAKIYNEQNKCVDIYVKFFKLLAVIGLPFFIILFFFGEQLFAFVFGQKWIEAGKIAESLAFLVYFQFISTPLSYTITFNKSQRIDLYFQVLRTIGAIAGIYVGFLYKSVYLSVNLYVLANCLYYVAQIILQLKVSSGWKSQIKAG